VTDDEKRIIAAAMMWRWNPKFNWGQLAEAVDAVYFQHPDWADYPDVARTYDCSIKDFTPSDD
jgi:hypothetical protein